MWGLGLSQNEMMLIGLDLGADVPLFIKGDNAFGGGVGEQLLPKKPIDNKLIIKIYRLIRLHFTIFISIN